MIVVQTPLRVSLFGGGTDFPEYFLHHGGGGVLSMAIDKFTYVIAKKRFDQMVRVSYSRTEVVDDASELHNELVRECLLQVGISAGIEIALMADVPSEGTGLGSSSSFIVGLLNALYRLRGHVATPRELAEQACCIERERLGQPVGFQDQYIAAFGGVRQIAFGQSGVTVEGAEEVHADTVDNHFVLVYTGRSRSAATILSHQRDNIPDRAAILGRMAGQVPIGRRLLAQGDFAGLGAELTRAWEWKRSLAANISDPGIDATCEAVRRAGACGYKVCGAGGGGFVLAVVEGEEMTPFRAALEGHQMLSVRVSQHGTRVLVDTQDDVEDGLAQIAQMVGEA